MGISKFLISWTGPEMLSKQKLRLSTIPELIFKSLQGFDIKLYPGISSGSVLSLHTSKDRDATFGSWLPSSFSSFTAVKFWIVSITFQLWIRQFIGKFEMLRIISLHGMSKSWRGISCQLSWDCWKLNLTSGIYRGNRDWRSFEVTSVAYNFFSTATGRNGH